MSAVMCVRMSVLGKESIDVASPARATADLGSLTLKLLLRCLGVAARIVEVVSDTTSGGQADDEGSS